MTNSEFEIKISPRLLAKHIDEMLPSLIASEREEDINLGIERSDEYWEGKLIVSRNMITKWFSEFLSDISYELYFEGNFKKNFAEIRQLLETAISMNPGMSEAFNNLGCLLARNGDFVGALQQIERALVVDPDNKAALKNFYTFSAETPVKSNAK